MVDVQETDEVKTYMIMAQHVIQVAQLFKNVNIRKFLRTVAHIHKFPKG